MATRVYKIKVTYPDWLYRFRWSNLKKYTKYLLNRPKCECCGKSVPFDNPEVTHNFEKSFGMYTGTRLIVNWYSKKTFCKECLADALLKNKLIPSFGEDFYDYDIAPVCEMQGCTSPAYKSFAFEFMQDKVDFRFCTTAWNHSKVCVDCVAETLKKGKEASSHWGQYKGKSVPMNKFGLPVVDGKVRFPW